jgi:hypothetical protein
MAQLEIVDMAQMAAPPPTKAVESALNADYASEIINLAARVGVAARVALADGDNPDEIESKIKWAALHTHNDVKIYRTGNLIYFYVAGPEPKEFLRQYGLRGPAAGT